MSLRTPLFEEHKKLGATIVDFGGWDMPVYYTNILEEHNSTRSACGLFDICHMGEIILEGPQAFDLIQWFFSRDISDLKIGQMALGVMCNPSGGIIDDLTIYRLGEEKFMAVVNASTREKDFAWMQKNQEEKGFDCSVEDISMRTAKLDIQGPAAEKILQKLVSFDLSKIGFYYFHEQGKSLLGLNSIISRSGYTGEDGFEVYFDWDECPRIWNSLLKEGRADGIVPVGLGARDTLRLEAAYNLYGSELDEQTNPFECRYGWVVGKEKDFAGRIEVFSQKEKGLKRALAGFEMLDRGIARHGYRVFSVDRPVGAVTSGSFSPTLKKNIGLCFIEPNLSQPGTRIMIEVRDKQLQAVIVKLPFYKRENKG
ncbi:MAG: glycine cleavage system aminomethyltransferase GcvT [Candidatus Diapherotrites archaeon]|nr:glycine cleavage system aminomethyltransferase GcvT [Candidatus Diapherotrites archaeon]